MLFAVQFAVQIAVRCGVSLQITEQLAVEFAVWNRILLTPAWNTIGEIIKKEINHMEKQ